ncbi:MAG: preprotein translocase subunit SecY, partial [Burkholderiaceae bacterium]
MATSPKLARSAASGFPWGRLWFLLAALVVFRIGAHIPVPGIDPVQLA